MARPSILMFNIDDSSTGELNKLCSALGFQSIVVPKTDYGKPIGALVGIPMQCQKPATPIDVFDEPMLVMCGLLSDQLDRFLQGLRQVGLPPIPLKAVLTPSNVAWSASELCQELKREHAAVQATRSAAKQSH